MRIGALMQVVAAQPAPLYAAFVPGPFLAGVLLELETRGVDFLAFPLDPKKAGWTLVSSRPSKSRDVYDSAWKEGGCHEVEPWAAALIYEAEIEVCGLAAIKTSERWAAKAGSQIPLNLPEAVLTAPS